MKLPLVASCLAAALSGAELASASQTQGRGTFSAWHAGLRLRDANQVHVDAYLKRAGDRTTLPEIIDVEPVAVGRTDYGRIKEQWPNLEVDAHSTGNSAFPSPDAEGKLIINNAWFTLTFSVSNSSTGAGHGPIGNAVAQGIAPGAELVSYYFEGSTRVDPNLVGTVVLEASREHVGLATVPTFDIEALDYGMGFIQDPLYDPDAPRALFSEDRSYYFSVTPEFANRPSSSTFWDDSGTMAQAHPGDVYLITYDGANWSTPTRHWSSHELGLRDDRIGDHGQIIRANVDAIEVHSNGSSLIYSTIHGDLAPSKTLDMETSQMMIKTAWSMPMVLRDLNDDRVTTKSRVQDNAQNEEIDSLCGIDPPFGSKYNVTYGLGLNTASHQSQTGPMGLSVCRFTPVGRVDEALVIQVTGWGESSPSKGHVHTYFIGQDVTDSTQLTPTAYHGNNGGWAELPLRPRGPSDNAVHIYVPEVDSVPEFNLSDVYSFYAIYVPWEDVAPFGRSRAAVQGF